MTEFLQRDFAHQNFFDLCIHEKQRLRQALNLLSNLLLTKIQLCSGSPNITGAISGKYGGLIDSSTVSSGALLHENVANAQIEASGQKRMNFSFDASRSSALYGTSGTIQPPALLGLACIKT